MKGTPWRDEIVNEVRATREAYLAQFDYDLKRMLRDLKLRSKEDPGPRANLELSKPREHVQSAR